jgi:hypothetical protein
MSVFWIYTTVYIRSIYIYIASAGRAPWLVMAVGTRLAVAQSWAEKGILVHGGGVTKEEGRMDGWLPDSRMKLHSYE